MILFPDSALQQLEFDKVQQLLVGHCRMELSRNQAENLRIHTHIDFVLKVLHETNEVYQAFTKGEIPPVDCLLNLEKELKLLSLPGAVLYHEEWRSIRSLLVAAEHLFQWLNAERRMTYPSLAALTDQLYYEKIMISWIDEVFDERGDVLDRASEELYAIRMQIYRKRQELRREFEKVVRRLQKQGYVAETEESFLNGRRVVALFAEHKRQVKGILLGESDSRRTVFMEPEETIELNNDLFSLEQEERKEVQRILRTLTERMSAYSFLLSGYYSLMGRFDFLRAKALLANDFNAALPFVHKEPRIQLMQARHPLLYFYHERQKKQTVPIDLSLNADTRVLLISGPNAGGKTVAMKTVGLLQLMLQSGLLVPVHPDSQMGIFKQIIIHIGDTQSIEHDLSTYSSHLQHMNYLLQHANEKTLFFVDEFGSGTDPQMGGAFAQVILEELVRKKARGIVTTHYLNLKVMAGQTPGIVNAAMSFDEQTLKPLYRLSVGQPGSSYTFAIAERIGFKKDLISRAQVYVDRSHFRLESLLRNAEKLNREAEEKQKSINGLLVENEKLKKEMTKSLQNDTHRKAIALEREKNRIAQQRWEELKELEKKIKLLAHSWRRSEDKQSIVAQIGHLLGRQQKLNQQEKKQKEIMSKYEDVVSEVIPGAFVRLTQSKQVGRVKELRGKKAIVLIGQLPLTVDIEKIIVIRPKEEQEDESSQA